MLPLTKDAFTLGHHLAYGMDTGLEEPGDDTSRMTPFCSAYRITKNHWRRLKKGSRGWQVPQEESTAIAQLTANSRLAIMLGHNVNPVAINKNNGPMQARKLCLDKLLLSLTWDLWSAIASRGVCSPHFDTRRVWKMPRPSLMKWWQ